MVISGACVGDAQCSWLLMVLLDATYKYSRSAKDPIDDGMVPLS